MVFLHQYNLISFQVVSIDSLTLKEEDSTQNSVSRLFAFKSRHSQESKTFCIFFQFFRYSTSYFSITTDLISSKKISVECSAPVQEKSIEKIFLIGNCIKFVKVEIFLRVFNKNDSSRLSKWCFSVITSLIFFMRVAMSNFTLRQKDSIQV